MNISTPGNNHQIQNSDVYLQATMIFGWFMVVGLSSDFELFFFITAPTQMRKCLNKSFYLLFADDTFISQMVLW